MDGFQKKSKIFGSINGVNGIINNNFIRLNNILSKDIRIKLLCYPRILGYVFNPLSVFFVYDNNKNYHKYRDTYLDRINGINDNLNYTNSELITLKDYYKRNREISIMLFSLSYILNIIDASVNAHLFEYEIDENISFKVEPLIENFNQAHISLKINI